MTGKRTEITPRTGTVEMVRTRGGTWVPPPVPQRRPVAHAVRVCVTPADPETYLAPDELCRLRARRHWLVPLRAMAKAAVSMPLAILLTALLAFLAPGA